MNPVGPPTGPAGNLHHIIAMRENLLEKNRLLQDLRHADSTATPLPQTGAGALNPAARFTGALQDAVGSVNATQQNASRLSEAYERGEVTDIAQVMLARQQSSVAFEATLQVRNKLLAAYQEIMRMGV